MQYIKKTITVFTVLSFILIGGCSQSCCWKTGTPDNFNVNSYRQAINTGDAPAATIAVIELGQTFLKIKD